MRRYHIPKQYNPTYHSKQHKHFNCNHHQPQSHHHQFTMGRHIVTLRAQGAAWVQRDSAKFFITLECCSQQCALSRGPVSVQRSTLQWAGCRMHCAKFYIAVCTVQRPLQRDWALKVQHCCALSIDHCAKSTVHWPLCIEHCALCTEHWANLHIAVRRASTNSIACNALQLCEPIMRCKCQIYFANTAINSHTPYNPLNNSTHFNSMDCTTQTFLKCITSARKCPKRVTLAHISVPKVSH